MGEIGGSGKGDWEWRRLEKRVGNERGCVGEEFVGWMLVGNERKECGGGGRGNRKDSES